MAKPESNTSAPPPGSDACFGNDQLWQHSLFAEVPRDEVEKLVAGMEVRCLAVGEVLIRPAEENHSLYLLLSGQMSVHLDAPDAASIFTIEPGECAGEMSIIEKTLTSAWVKGSKPGALLVVPEDYFWERYISVPGAIKNLLRVLVRRMRKTNEAILKALEERLRYEHLQKELDDAGHIQANILPQQNPLFPNHPQVDVAAFMQPAKQVGGDFYDAIPLDRDRIAIAIGDISGKGMPAALLMVRMLTALRLNLIATEMAAVMPTVNRMACENNEEMMFATIFFAVLNVRTGRLQYVNAGHNPPFIARRGAAFDFLPMSRGVLAGISEDARYTVDELRLAPGDALVLYTDGVTEAEDVNGEFFQEEKALAVLNRALPGDAHGLVANLKDAIAEFVAGNQPSDDITILALRYL
ncbi:MAG: SpoIIE family protein phosphatase [Pseudomonadota bacterium]